MQPYLFRQSSLKVHKRLPCNISTYVKIIKLLINKLINEINVLQ